MAIKAVAFDVFGTLVRIERPTRPFRKLVRLLHEAGRQRQRDDGIRAMSNVLDLRQAANLFGGMVSEEDLCALEAELHEEIQSISLFDDAIPTMAALKDRGIKVALCSNLAAPYGPPVLKLLPVQPDFCAWSYEASAVKPQPEIYQYLCDGIGCRPEEILMVGDTIEADMVGPRKFGIHGYHLNRQASTPASSDSLRSLSDVLHLI
ncbi:MULTISPECIES: HAD family hydrolase [Achromobacter]|uniref:HAD family hydrolase n=1 Tax=Achromobacter spanius TaxID=217203 RepID=A0ABY8GMP6_9BURK|nr:MULTISPECIES: HAD family hydrolase [Achromobacter]WAI84804.1 HAD family hydrolase [Achromobacter spanius]WEX94887.1 HAD family hydrolase [Achromobacter sp. SS2-2022]WFP05945.1 HAD family hydrolase [Achromobacter spanius]